jgi:hypothetical protein
VVLPQLPPWKVCCPRNSHQSRCRRQLGSRTPSIPPRPLGPRYGRGHRWDPVFGVAAGDAGGDSWCGRNWWRGRNDGRGLKLCEVQLHVTPDVRRHLGPLGTVTAFPGMRRKTGAAGQTIKLVAIKPSQSLRKKAEDFQVRDEHFHFFQNEQELLDLRPAHSLEIVWLKALACASKKSR